MQLDTQSVWRHNVKQVSDLGNSRTEIWKDSLVCGFWKVVLTEGDVTSSIEDQSSLPLTSAMQGIEGGSPCRCYSLHPAYCLMALPLIQQTVWYNVTTLNRCSVTSIWAKPLSTCVPPLKLTCNSISLLGGRISQEQALCVQFKSIQYNVVWKYCMWIENHYFIIIEISKQSQEFTLAINTIIPLRWPLKVWITTSQCVTSSRCHITKQETTHTSSWWKTGVPATQWIVVRLWRIGRKIETSPESLPAVPADSAGVKTLLGNSTYSTGITIA